MGRAYRLGPCAGEELAAFAPYGLAAGHLLRPVSLAVWQDRVYVLDGETHQVSVFSDQGEYLFRFGGRGEGMADVIARPSTAGVLRICTRIVRDIPGADA
mgnify:CR=1 FL=1